MVHCNRVLGVKRDHHPFWIGYYRYRECEVDRSKFGDHELLVAPAPVTQPGSVGFARLWSRFDLTDFPRFRYQEACYLYFPPHSR